MVRSLCLLFGCLLGGVGACHAAGQAASATPPSATVTRQNGPTKVTSEAYTQLHAAMSPPALPQDPKQKKKFFGILLKAMGGGKATREINVGIRVKIGAVALPEYPLLTYRFDPDTGNPSVVTDGGHSFPLKRLEANEKIQVEAVYRDTTSAHYDTGAIATAVTALLPGSSIVSEVAKPAIQHVFELTDATWNAMSSQATDQAFREELSPYAADAKTIVIALSGRGGEPFGTVTLSLRATPTLLQTPVDVFQFGQQAMVRGPADSPSRLNAELAGVKRSFTSVLRALPDYTELIRAPSGTTLRSFCRAAREELVMRNGLTLVDSTYVTYAVMAEAGFASSANRLDWFDDCFDSGERAVLAQANGIAPPPVAQAPASVVPPEHLFAFGCWMMDAAGPDCADKAPAADATLAKVLQDDVALAIDSSFLATVSLRDPAHVPKGVVISMLKGSAASFSCFKRGMLVSSREGKPFRFQAEYRDDRIGALAIYPVAETALSCTN
ncbi:hypothetical protein [Xanthomonas bundabergensis]|uniref:hypothetical protein n=1 Tax=Xanthomonas bundabergensis TaxID=3160842 RepID=UPI003511525E